jgi:hypothetical protein
LRFADRPTEENLQIATFSPTDSPFELYDLEMDKISFDRGKALYGEMRCPEARSSELFDSTF